MTKNRHITPDQLPRKYQDQIAVQLWEKKNVTVPSGKQTPARSILRQQQGDGLNKTERAFFEYLKERCHGEGNTFAHPVTLRLANGLTYTPDFMVTLPLPAGGAVITFYEVKGFMRDDAAVKLKVAASFCRWAQFYLVRRKRGQGPGNGSLHWDIQKVLP